MLKRYAYIGLEPFNHTRLTIEKPPITPELILDTVCQVTGLSKESVTGKARQRELVDARCIVIGMALKFDRQLTLKELGYLLNCHHSTIIYQRERFEYDYMTNRDFKKTVDTISKLIA